MVKEKSFLQDLSLDVWWVVMFRGIIMAIFGIFLLTNPGALFLTLLIFFGAYLFVDGWFNVFDAILHRRHVEDWGMILLMGIVEILAGLLVLAQPIFSGVFTMMFLYLWIAIGSIVFGITSIVSGFKVRKEIRSETEIAGGLAVEWILFLGGILGLVFGVLLLVNPEGSARVITIIWGVLAILGGIGLFFFSFRMRRFGKKGLAAERS